MSNIKLGYRVVIERDDRVFYADSAEFFDDEDGHQWVKFIARNGSYIGREHMLRTDNATIIRHDAVPAEAAPEGDEPYDRIKGRFNDLYVELTSATNRASLGDMSGFAKAVHDAQVMFMNDHGPNHKPFVPDAA